MGGRRLRGDRVVDSCGAGSAVGSRREALHEDPANVADGCGITSRILVAGIGNIFLGDDGFGSEVMRRMPRRLGGDRVRLVDYGISGMHLAYDLLDEWDALVLIDALPNRGSPGALHVFEADHEMHTVTAGLDAHAMDPAAVFASLNALGGTPPHTVIVGCEVANVEDGIGLSDAVAATVPAAVQTVEDVVARLLTPVREG